MESIINIYSPRSPSGNIGKPGNKFFQSVFSGNRITRQRINNILSKKIPVEKSDIVTLNFFIIANESQRSRKENSDEFIKSTNALLRSCDFFELYYLNPFDCFVMLCLWTEDPFGTYSDVWEYECLPDAPEAKDV